MQTVRAADTNEVVKLIFRESDNDRKVSKWLIAKGGQPPTAPGLQSGAVQGTEASLTPQVVLQLEKKLFDYFNQDVFRDNNGTAVSFVLRHMCGHPGSTP